MTSNIEILFNKILETREQELSSALQIFVKGYCKDEQQTSVNLNLFYNKLKQIVEGYNNDNSILLKKSLISLGIISKYIPCADVLERFADKFIKDILLPIYLNKDKFTEEIQTESMKTFTLLVQVFQEKLENHLEIWVQNLQITQDNRDSVITFLLVLIQVSPLLVINHSRFIEELIQFYVTTQDTALHNELTQMLGQFFQLFIPFKAFSVDDDEDEDINSNTIEDEEKSKAIEAIGNKISIPILTELVNHLVEPKSLEDEPSLLFLGIMTGYSFIYLQPEITQIPMNTYCSQLEKESINDKDNRKQTVSIIQSLRIALSNLYAIKDNSNSVYQELFVKTYKTLLSIIQRTKDYFKQNQSKGVQNFYFKVRNSIIFCIGSVIKKMNNFFKFADEFLKFAGILADPLVLSDFIIALLNDIKNTSDEKEKSIKKEQFKEKYLPNIVEPLLSELAKPIQKYKSVTKHIIQSLGTIISNCQELYLEYFQETITILNQFINSNFKTISKYMISVIETYSKLLNILQNDQLYKVEYLQSIFNVYFKILNNSNEIKVDQEDEEDEDDQENQSPDSDVIAKIVFTILESIFNALPLIKNRIESDSPKLVEDIYNILSEQLKSEVIFEADRYLRMMEMDLIQELYKNFNTMEFIKSESTSKQSISQLLRELLMIQYQIEVGEEEEFKNQRLDICLKVFNFIKLQANYDNVQLETLFNSILLSLSSISFDKTETPIQLSDETITISKKLIFNIK